MTLHLEYQITKAEKKEAQALHQEVRHGKRLKWIVLAVFYGVILLEVVVLILRFIFEVKRGERVWFFAILAVVIPVVIMFQRLTRRKTDEPVRLDVSERELVFQGDGSRVAILWSSFSKFMESQNLFVVLDGSKRILYMIPKRAFPDQAAQDWFRVLGSQPRSVAPAVADETPIPGRFVAANGIALTLQLRLGDYVNRMFTSWRFKGIVLGVLVLTMVMCLVTPDSPEAVNSRGKTLAIMLALMIPIFAVVFFAVIAISWLSERKYRKPQQIALTDEGIEFTAHDASGRMPWSTYKYYMENRWSFFVWNPRGSLWFMFPKREFTSPSDIEQ